MSLVGHLRTSQRVASVMETDEHRFMLIDDTIVGCEHREPSVRHQIAFSAMALMASLVYLSPPPSSALCLGLGAGTVPRHLRASGIRTDVVEIDEAVIRLAEQHFLFGAPSVNGGGVNMGRVLHDDALRLVAAGPAEGADGRYDLVLSDLWDGANEGRSLSRAFFVQLRESWLRPGGVLAVNLLAFVHGPHIALAVNVARTLRAVFAHVQVFVEHDPVGASADDDSEPANLLLLASEAPLAHSTPPLSGVDGEAALDGSMEHLFAHFEAWQPARLRAAADGLEGTILEKEADWAALLPERIAVNSGMRAQQRPLLSAEAWASIASLLEEAEETPPRKLGGRAPAPRAPQSPASTKEEL